MTLTLPFYFKNLHSTEHFAKTSFLNSSLGGDFFVERGSGRKGGGSVLFFVFCLFFFFFFLFLFPFAFVFSWSAPTTSTYDFGLHCTCSSLQSLLRGRLLKLVTLYLGITGPAWLPSKTNLTWILKFLVLMLRLLVLMLRLLPPYCRRRVGFCFATALVQRMIPTGGLVFFFTLYGAFLRDLSQRWSENSFFFFTIGR